MAKSLGGGRTKKRNQLNKRRGIEIKTSTVRRVG